MWKKYNDYMNHNIHFTCSDVTFDLLKTGLTEKQLLLLDKRESIFDTVIIYMFLLGLVAGFGLFYMIMVTEL